MATVRAGAGPLLDVGRGLRAAAAAACGDGWATIEFIAQPDETALLALAARLCQE